MQVQVALSLETPRLTVPDTAVQYDQIGAYVLVVDKENTVVLKRVTLGPVQDGHRAISQGITAADPVIIGGLQNATPGNRVAPQYEKKTA